MHGCQKPGFGDRTSLQPAKTAKNPVSLDARVVRVSTSLNHRGFGDRTSLQPAKTAKNPASLDARVVRVSTSLNHRGFGDRTSLQWAKTAKNPVSVVLMPQSCQSLEILIVCGWSHRTGLVDKQIFGAVVLVDTVDVWFTFQSTGKAKCIHAIFAIAHLVLADEFSLL